MVVEGKCDGGSGGKVTKGEMILAAGVQGEGRI